MTSLNHYSKKRALYFASARELDDEHEGSLTDQEFKNMFDLDFSTISEGDFHLMKKFYRHFRFGPYSAYEVLREFTKINCWHLNEYESFAMWDIYTKESKGIALQSTIDGLCSSIHGYKIKPEHTGEPIWIGRVKYIDYVKGTRDRVSDGVDRFLYKRASFLHEQEIRLLVSLRMAAEFGVDFPKLGIFVPVDLGKLISKIYVSPYLVEKDVEDVRSLVSKYNYQFPIIPSNLKNDPVY